jgi:hypothetical protein
MVLLGRNKDFHVVRAKKIMEIIYTYIPLSYTV